MRRINDIFVTEVLVLILVANVSLGFGVLIVNAFDLPFLTSLLFAVLMFAGFVWIMQRLGNSKK